MGKRGLVLGIGINDADYPVQVNESVWENGVKKLKVKWRCPYYRVWVNMLQRSYSEKEKKKNKRYENAEVREEWIYFSCFKAWMETQDWEGKELDKDILVEGNLIYGPDTCLFVDKNINVLFKSSSSVRGEYPLGVTLHKRTKLFHSRTMHNGKVVYCGIFEDPWLAHRAYQKTKISLLASLIEDGKENLDSRILDALRRKMEKIQNDYEKGLETFDF